ncbi:glycosyltransferase family 4 protein [Brevundimonas sp. GN22]
MYALSAPVSHVDLLNEVALTDAAPRPAQSKSIQKIKRYVRNRTNMFGANVRLVKPSGQVITPNGKNIEANTFWVEENIFHRANQGYRNNRHFTPVRFKPQSEQPDVMHWTCPLPLNAKGRLNIYTFHDLIPLKIPHTTLENKSIFYTLCMDIISKADHIIAVSDTTKRDLIEILGADERRITTTYQAIDIPNDISDRSDDEIENDLASIFNLGWKGFFLHFGAIEPKKNLARIVEAYATSGCDIPLVLVGKIGWLEKSQLELIETIRSSQSGLSQRIIQYDFLSKNLLYTLIRGARATIFPSLYEGFGLPILESMALGTPVITSRGGATQEIGGDAGVYVDPHDVSSIRQAIRFMSDTISESDEIVCRGRKVAAKFSNVAYRERLDAVYRRLL